MAVSDGAAIQWWDVSIPDHPTLLSSIGAPADPRHRPVFGPDCRTLTIVDDQQQVQVWDMDSAGLLSSDALPVQDSEVLRLIQTADGAQVAGADTDRWVHLWRPDTISDAQRLDELRDWRAVSLSSDGRWLATLEDDAVALREMITGESRQLPLVVLPDGTDLSASSDVLIGPEARHVLVETFDGVVHVLDGVTGQELHYITDGPPVATWGISRDRLAASFPDGLVRLWDLTVFADLAVVEPITFTGPISNVLGLSLSPDGQRLAATGDSGAIEVWDLAQQRRLLALPAPSEASGFVITGGGTALNDDGSLLAVAEPPSSEADGAVGQIAIWDVDAERRISVIPQSNLAPILAFDSVGADGPGLIIGAGDTLRLDLYRRALSSGELALKAAEVAGCQLDPSLSDSADRRVLESLPDCLKLLLPDDAAAEP
jgi:WD40 repeat protein